MTTALSRIFSGREYDICVIIEYCPHGNLLKFLRARRESYRAEWLPHEEQEKGSLCVESLVSYAYQISRAMEFLASRKVSHPTNPPILSFTVLECVFHVSHMLFVGRLLVGGLDEWTSRQKDKYASNSRTVIRGREMDTRRNGGGGGGGWGGSRKEGGER